MKAYKEHNSLIYASSVRSEMLGFVPETAKRILDVGCSVGNFGGLLKSERSGSEVWGVEVDREASVLASQKLDKVINDKFDRNLNLPANYFDCVVFNDVLEHLVDPYEALEYAKELLNENGKVVASIPNVRYFGNIWMLVVHKSWEYTDSGILDRTHLRFFTKNSIKKTFEELGYKIETLEGINGLEVQDPYYMRKFKFLNLISRNHLEDMRWMQFAVVASPDNN